MIRYVKVLFCALIVASVPVLSVAVAGAVRKPEKVLIVVFDQMRPEIRGALQHVLEAMNIPQSKPADGKAWSFQR
ncbi:MAG TPA: hypothetical protein VLA73_03750 [Burkholderiales bacterium]|nr:hypothetical protein [Burkholderiales bacterium]